MERYQQYMYSYPHKTAYGLLTGIRLDDYKAPLEASKENSLYVHIPFCEAKCGYCNLFSLAGAPERVVDDYLDAMEKQLAQYALGQVVFNDWVIGGGTPLYLSEKQLERLFALIEGGIHFRESAHDIVIETSPRQTTKSKAQLLKAHGVTRVSMGIQSFNRQELMTLGRLHEPKDSYRALEILKNEGFPCLNLDLIYGISGQSVASLMDSLRQLLSFEPEEVFIYPLYVKPGTGLFAQGQRVSPQGHEMYEALREGLLMAGYGQTSMRRFVRGVSPADGSWQGCGFSEHTLSLGCGGRSYIDELHFCAPYRIDAKGRTDALAMYLETMDYQNITHGYQLSLDERKRRFVIKNLLYIKGVPTTAYEGLFGQSLLADFPILQQWIDDDYAFWNPFGHLCLTPLGLGLSDYLGPQLISPEVKAKMEAWRDG